MKRTVFWLAAVVVLLALGTLGASAEEGVPLKPLAPGTVFTFNTLEGPVTVTIKEMEGISIFESRSSNPSLTRENIGFGVLVRAERHELMSVADRELVAKLFPLKVGNTVQFEYSGTSTSGFDWRARCDMKVTEVKQVTVPAGSFNTYVITTATRTDVVRNDNTCWYAPEIGYCVKRVYLGYNSIRGTREKYDWELVSVTPPAEP